MSATATATRTHRTSEATVTTDPQHSTPYVRAWAAPSRTHIGVTYTVTYDALENAWACQCPAYTYRGHCAHLNAAIDALVAEWREKLEGLHRRPGEAA